MTLLCCFFCVTSPIISAFLFSFFSFFNTVSAFFGVVMHISFPSFASDSGSMPSIEVAVFTAFFIGIFLSHISMVASFFCDISFRHADIPPLVGSFAYLIKSFISDISFASGFVSEIMSVSKSNLWESSAVPCSAIPPDIIILSPFSTLASRIFFEIPMLVVFITILSSLPFSITFVSPVTIGIWYFFERLFIVFRIFSRVLFSNPSSKINARDMPIGCPPIISMSFIVPAKARSPMFPPGKIIGFTTKLSVVKQR